MTRYQFLNIETFHLIIADAKEAAWQLGANGSNLTARPGARCAMARWFTPLTGAPVAPIASHDGRRPNDFWEIQRWRIVVAMPWCSRRSSRVSWD